MHELSLAEENYGCASEDYSSILALGAMVAAIVFSVTIILGTFALLIVEVFVNVIMYFVHYKLKWLRYVKGTMPSFTGLFTECTIRILFILLINVMFS